MATMATTPMVASATTSELRKRALARLMAGDVPPPSGSRTPTNTSGRVKISDLQQKVVERR